MKKQILKAVKANLYTEVILLECLFAALFGGLGGMMVGGGLLFSVLAAFGFVAATFLVYVFITIISHSRA